jgi:hypothetical protein
MALARRGSKADIRLHSYVYSESGGEVEQSARLSKKYRKSRYNQKSTTWLEYTREASEKKLIDK